MDKYFLNKEDWDALLELGLGELQGDLIMKKIPSNVKSAFTRTYNKMSHPTPFSRTSLVGGKKTGGAERKTAVDFEEAIEDDLEVEEADAEKDESDGEDKMIKQKPAAKGKKAASSSAKPKAKGKGKAKA